MKFISKSSYYENIRAWHEHALNTEYTTYESLNSKEKARLMSFNQLLHKFENKYLPILDAKLKELQTRVADPSDWMQDFNFDYVITFYLRENDPEYEEEDDNILMQIESMHQDCNDWGFGFTDNNYADRQCFSDEHHCYTYHQLYDHFDLDWLDFFRIGAIEFELKIDDQSDFLAVN